MDYIVYYTCPNCKEPICGHDPEKEANEMFTAPNQKQVRKQFNQYKLCRHMKISRIEEVSA